jgi:Domain of unknown function (DUF4062)
VSQRAPDEAVIRTPDRRLRVFVSSTLSDLAEERQAVSRAVSALRLTPVMFEAGARPYPPARSLRTHDKALGIPTVGYRALGYVLQQVQRAQAGQRVQGAQIVQHVHLSLDRVA